jgi:hypothetical protein
MQKWFVVNQDLEWLCCAKNERQANKYPSESWMFFKNPKLKQRSGTDSMS